MNTTIKFNIDNGIAYISIDKISTRNALLPDDVHLLRGYLKDAEDDDEVRLVILGGKGHFCSGVDIRALDLIGEGKRWARLGDFITETFEPLIQMLSNFGKPTMAVLDGVVAGAGLSIALNCDFRLATKRICISPAFSKLGLIPDCGGTWFLPRILGAAKALEFASLSDSVDALQAQQLGLVTWVEDAATQEVILSRAKLIAALPCEATVQLRKLIANNWSRPLYEAVRAESIVMSKLGESNDFREGLLAFRDRRAPVFNG